MRTLAAVAAALAVSLSAAAEEPASPRGPVALTVAGAIDKANRPPFDAARDAFFDYHERSFDKAFAFDLAMLEAFSQRRAVIDRGVGPETFSGPRLAEVLESVGCRGRAHDACARRLRLRNPGGRHRGARLDSGDGAVNGQPLPPSAGAARYGCFSTRPASALRPMKSAGTWPWALFYIRCEGAAGSRPKSRSTRQPSPSRA